MSSEQDLRPMESQGRERLGIPFRTTVFALFIYITGSPRTKLSLLLLIPQLNLYPILWKNLSTTHSDILTIGSRMFRYCFGFKSWKKKSWKVYVIFFIWILRIEGSLGSGPKWDVLSCPEMAWLVRRLDSWELSCSHEVLVAWAGSVAFPLAKPS